MRRFDLQGNLVPLLKTLKGGRPLCHILWQSAADKITICMYECAADLTSLQASVKALNLMWAACDVSLAENSKMCCWMLDPVKKMLGVIKLGSLFGMCVNVGCED